MSTTSGFTFDLTRSDHAYLFGFLQTDGHHSVSTRNRGKITVELNSRDRPILEAFQRMVPYPSSITIRTRTTNFAAEHTSAVWTLCAFEARQQLLALGLPTGHKSKIIAPPTVEYSRIDYLRALIDADGSVGWTGKGYPFIGFVTASEALALHYCDELERLTGARRTARRNRRDAVYNLLVINEVAQELAAKVYCGGLALPRKAAVAAELGTWTRPAGMRVRAQRRVWTADEDEVVLRLSIAEAAKALGRTSQSVNLRRWRLRNMAA